MPSDGQDDARPAHLFDGVSARDHAVGVSVAAGRIVVVPERPDKPPQCPLGWPLAESYPVRGGRADRLTVATRAAPDARLVIHDPALRARIAPALRPKPAGTAATRAAVRWAVGLSAAVALIVAAAGFASLHAARFLPAGWGGELSDAMLEQISTEHPLCTRPEGLAAVGRLSARMAAALDVPDPTVVIVDWGLVNAFALPGGRVVVTSGLIRSAGSAAALAGVLAHEIGHVARRDPLARLLRGKLVDVALSAVFGVSPHGGTTSAIAGFLLENSYTREQEEAADAAAVRVLNALDIDPGPSAGFFDRLAEADSGLNAVTWFRSHPLSAGRAERLRLGGSGHGTGLTAEEWRAVEAVCR